MPKPLPPGEPETLFQGKYLRLLSRETWEFVQRSNCTGIVIILAMTPRGKVLFVEQYRVPVASRVIEFPAGLIGDDCGPGESIEDAAARELLEETGYRAGRLELVMSGPVSAGLSSDRLHIYRAYDLKKESAGGGDAVERITVHEVALDAIPGWLKKMEKKGRLVDPKTYAGIYFLTQHGPRSLRRPGA